MVNCVLKLENSVLELETKFTETGTLFMATGTLITAIRACSWYRDHSSRSVMKRRIGRRKEQKIFITIFTHMGPALLFNFRHFALYLQLRGEQII